MIGQPRSYREFGRLLPALLLFMLYIASGLPAAAQDLRVTAAVSTDTVGIQDQFQLTITATGSESGQAQASKLPRFQGLRVVAGPSLSTQYQWVNGRSTSSKSFVYLLMPEKEGQYTIDPIEVTIGNRVFRTQPIPIRVTSASPAPAAAPRGLSGDPLRDDPATGTRRSQATNEDVFVSAEVDRASAYPGQQVTLTYHLYTQENVTGLQLQESPPLNGFWVENLDVEQKPPGTRRVINGREYLDYVVKRQALFANAPGRLKIPTSTFAVSVKTAGDLFGFFGQSDTLYRKTREIDLNIVPLPETDRPEGFRNAVGVFTLASELDKPGVAAGEAVSLRVKLAGKGNLKEIPDLPLPAMPDMTIYSSKREDNIRAVSGNQIGGEKIWDYVIVPKVPGDHTIPSLAFSFFNPDRGGYETVTTSPIFLKVAPGKDGGSSFTGLSGLNKQNLTRLGTDINFIKLNAPDLELRQKPLYASPWVYALAGLPLLANAGIILFQRRARRSADGAQARIRRAKRMARRRLREAAKAGRLEPRRYYDGAAAALTRYLGDRFNLPDIAMTADSLERNLEANGVAPETVKAVLAAMQECDFGRFVSASSPPERRKELALRIQGIIRSLESSES